MPGTNLNRRHFLGVVGSASVVGLAGCAADDDSDSDDEAESDDDETESEPEDDEPETTECRGDTFDCTMEFAETVLDEIGESGDTPEPINAGVFESAEGEAVDDEAMLFAAFDLTNENTLGTQIGNMVFGPMYENWSDYPETSTFHFGVFPTTDGEDRRTTMYVEKWWLDGVDDGEFTTDEVGEMIVDTSSEPLHQVIN